MNKIILILLVVFVASCSRDQLNDDSSAYFSLINKAELAICKNDFEQALDHYKSAFQDIRKPFGKDLFNAALCSQLANQLELRNTYLQRIVNNSDKLDYVKSAFVGSYLSSDEWQGLISNQSIEYDTMLRKEFKEILKRDQLFRPMYETHDDTINANRIINLNRIIELTDSEGFPSHIELGFTNHLRSQNHHIVLHHTAQRRSRDKSVMDLESLLHNAVKTGRIDPEKAILYMNFQNDTEKGRFEVYSTWQYYHHLLPDSLNNKIWLPKLSEEQKTEINSKRKAWYANSIEDIATKTAYLGRVHIPFIFTCVRKSIGHLRDDIDQAKALEQYMIPTSGMQEYKVDH